MTLLNLAEICPQTHTLGPGQRFALWVQGCCFSCPGCVSPDWIPEKTVVLVEPQRLGDYILSLPSIEGVTISGGEPMLQAQALGELGSYLRQHRDLSLICFTGFTLAQLQAKSDAHINYLLNLLDVLIDGLYISELNDNRGWRGSANQKVHFLSPRYFPQSSLFTERVRDVEVHIREGSVLMVGVPPQNFAEHLKGYLSCESPTL